MTDLSPREPPPDQARGLHVGVAGTLALAAIGFFTGLRGESHDVSALLASRPMPTTTVKARSYGDMRGQSFGPNSALYPGLFAQLSAAPPASALVPPQTQAEREAALQRRALRRAYDGAPPTVPHRVEQIDAPSCLGCHESGAAVGASIAPKMSHNRHDNCLQCHVVSADPRPHASAPPPLTSSSFEGLPAPSGGSRAWPGAPPTIPHTSAMRSDCMSCHGPFGALGMKTTHPQRQNCLQCHALSAAADHRPPQGTPGPLGALP